MTAADPVLTLAVYGRPAPQGSKRAFINKHTGRAQMTEQSPLVGAWRDTVRTTAIQELAGLEGFPLDGPIVATFVFSMPKPGSIPRDRLGRPSVAPDVSKLARSTEDALQDAGVLRDDALIVEYVRLAKVYAGLGDPDALGTPGAVIRIWRLADIQLWGAPATPAAPALFEPSALS